MLNEHFVCIWLSEGISLMKKIYISEDDSLKKELRSRDQCGSKCLYWGETHFSVSAVVGPDPRPGLMPSLALRSPVLRQQRFCHPN